MPNPNVTKNGDEVVINSSIDELFENMPLGSVSKAIGNNLYGINFRQTGNAVPMAKDMYGFTFFTRPQLNLTQTNITNYRNFYNLLTQNKASYQFYTRLMLDPRLGSKAGITSPLVDPFNPFIPILTNNIVSLSGWPDITLPTYTSEAGLYGEEHSIVDGAVNHFESYDLDVTFRNTKGNPLLYLFYIWETYATLVYEGILNPYLDMIVENEIDYNTRIYRIVLDQQKRYVTNIGCTGASFPISNPVGATFDYNIDKPYNTANKEINIRFKCNGFLAFSDIIKLNFNKVLGIFNGSMRSLLASDIEGGDARDDDTIVYRHNGYVKIPYSLSAAMDSSVFANNYFGVNYRVYPYINLLTNELEWWVNEKVFNKKAQEDFKNDIENGGQSSNNAEDEDV